ncbi:unnamed protein product [Paramecium octaurelia]|uniref:Uncharacterized protein n=1 Tax=Paramecium octaurelia TaxID=43137 RepID=A0A8S1XDV2_PAROT|nr:unnamed protein product [Paramecium octaurelia]
MHWIKNSQLNFGNLQGNVDEDLLDNKWNLVDLYLIQGFQGFKCSYSSFRNIVSLNSKGLKEQKQYYKQILLIIKKKPIKLKDYEVNSIIEVEREMKNSKGLVKDMKHLCKGSTFQILETELVIGGRILEIKRLINYQLLFQEEMSSVVVNNNAVRIKNNESDYEYRSVVLFRKNEIEKLIDQIVRFFYEQKKVILGELKDSC